MSLETAAEYALMLTDPGPLQPTAQGPGTLSARERELVTLVARGRPDAQIAEQLYISIRTVRSHLARDPGQDRLPPPRRPDPPGPQHRTGLATSASWLRLYEADFRHNGDKVLELVKFRNW